MKRIKEYIKLWSNKWIMRVAVNEHMDSWVLTFSIIHIIHTVSPYQEALISLNVYLAFSSSSYIKQVSECLWDITTHVYQIGTITDLCSTPNDCWLWMKLKVEILLMPSEDVINFQYFIIFSSWNIALSICLSCWDFHVLLLCVCSKCLWLHLEVPA